MTKLQLLKALSFADTASQIAGIEPQSSKTYYIVLFTEP